MINMSVQFICIFIGYLYIGYLLYVSNRFRGWDIVVNKINKVIDLWSLYYSE